MLKSNDNDIDGDVTISFAVPSHSISAEGRRNNAQLLNKRTLSNSNNTADGYSALSVAEYGINNNNKNDGSAVDNPVHR